MRRQESKNCLGQSAARRSIEGDYRFDLRTGSSLPSRRCQLIEAWTGTDVTAQVRGRSDSIRFWHRSPPQPIARWAQAATHGCASSDQRFRVSRRMTFYMRINMARRRSGSAKGYDGRYSITSKEAGSPSTFRQWFDHSVPSPQVSSTWVRRLLKGRTVQMTHRQNGGSYGSVGNQSREPVGTRTRLILPGLPATTPDARHKQAPSG